MIAHLRIPPVTTITHVLYDTTPSARRCLSCHVWTRPLRLDYTSPVSFLPTSTKRTEKTGKNNSYDVPYQPDHAATPFRPSTSSVAAGKFAHISHLTLDAPIRHRTRLPFFLLSFTDARLLRPFRDTAVTSCNLHLSLLHAQLRQQPVLA